jgi:multidrug transporter EmrE-like cation transporter
MEDVAKLCLYSVGGDLALRDYALTGNTMNLGLGYLGYGLALRSLISMYQAGKSLGAANNIWNSTTGLLEMLLSVYLGEHVAQEQWAGAILVCTGLLLI